MASCCAGRGWLVLEDADLTESAGVNPEAAAARLPAVGATRVDPVLTDAIAGSVVHGWTNPPLLGQTPTRCCLIPRSSGIAIASSCANRPPLTAALLPFRSAPARVEGECVVAEFDEVRFGECRGDRGVMGRDVGQESGLGCPVLMYSSRSGRPAASCVCRKSASLVTTMRSFTSAKAMISASLVSPASGRSLTWTASWPRAIRCVTRMRGNCASTMNFIGAARGSGHERDDLCAAGH